MADQPDKGKPEIDFEKIFREAAESGDITELGMNAAVSHELFSAFLEKEFSPAQALYLTASILTGGPGPAPAN